MSTIHAVVSLPRYVARDSIITIWESLACLGIAPRIPRNVYWHKGMENAFARIVGSDAEWIVAIDGDAVFSHQQLSQLIQITEEHRGAIIPRMASRDGEVLLFHFGCTLIRVEDLITIEQPWFVGDDPDIGFWSKWRSAGLPVHFADVEIGHLNELVGLPDGRNLTLGEWRKSACPDRVYAGS